MSKFRKIILAVLISCFAVCAGLAVAACTDKSAANFRMPKGYNPDGSFSGRYTISVKSAGGMTLDGVRVDVKKGGSTVVSGISKNGYISLNLEPDIYQLVVDSNSLPEGYYLDDKQYYTKADEGDVDILLYSRVINNTGSSGTVYSAGDVMHDFAFNDAVSGAKYTLSELLDEKNGYKAVMLNFFYVDCSPCRLEFPAIEEAYEAYSDKMAVVALSYQDSAADIAAFAQQRGLKFHLGYDSSGITSRFNVSAFPTTVIVDRYGIVAEINREGGKFESSYWRSMFLYYTSDKYSLKPPETKPDPEKPTEFTKPDEGLVMPEPEAIAAALNGEVKGNASIDRYYAEEGKDKDYSWPWLIKTEDGKSYLDAPNVGKDYSFATLYAQIRLTAGDAISYEYFVKTEAEHDILYVLVNGDIVAQHSSNSEGWKESLAVYVATRNETATVAFMYYKDIGTNADNERASIRNLNIRPVREVVKTVDQKTSLVDNLTYDTGYNNDLTGNYNVSITQDKTKDDSGYYYYNGAIVLADILNAGFWAEKHLGSATFVNEEGSNTASSVYQLSFWTMSNYKRADKESPLLFDYLTEEQSENFIEDYYLQGFSDNGLLPVTDNLIAILKAFIDAMYENYPDAFVAGDEKYDGQWLEFCYYYKHYGDAHNPDDKDYHECYETLDPIKGLVYYNALTAYEGTAEQPVANKVNVTKIINLSDGGGVKFKFVPDHTGVYLFYSKAPAGKGTDPKLIVFDEKLNRLLEADNDMRYNSYIYRESHDEYYAYVWLEAKKTYYVHGAMGVAGDTGSYDMYIEYQGKETVNYLTFASVGDGVFTFNEKPYYVYYVAVNVAYNSADNCYYHYTDDYQFGSKIYINFVHNNYFDRKGHSLYELIENGVFDFRKNGGRDYTTEMRKYYRKATYGKNKGDELYGLVEADETLVNILSFACQIYYEEGASSGAWEMFACYYEYIGNPNPADN